MAVDSMGQTIYSPYDYHSAIMNRLGIIDQVGEDANQASALAAARHRQMQDFQDNMAMQQAQGRSDLIQQSNQQHMQSSPGTNVQGDNLFGAIRQQESGGNYHAVNKDSGALGAYQVMPGNLGGSHSGWDWETLHRDVTPQQFLASPQIQDQIAQAKLQGYMDKYGPAGAAVAWYAGPGTAQHYQQTGALSQAAQAGGYPSISGYVQSVLRRLGL